MFEYFSARRVFLSHVSVCYSTENIFSSRCFAFPRGSDSVVETLVLLLLIVMKIQSVFQHHGLTKKGRLCTRSKAFQTGYKGSPSLETGQYVYHEDNTSSKIRREQCPSLMMFRYTWSKQVHERPQVVKLSRDALCTQAIHC